MGDRTGDANANGFYQTVKSGRLVISLRTASGHTCTFSSNERAVMPTLRERIEASATHPIAGLAGKAVETPEGWISVATLRPLGDQGATFSVGVHIFSPLEKFLQPRAVLVPLAAYILVMNALAALMIVILLIRRIKRADEAATAWTSGDLATRIHDTGQDEFSGLAQKFDMMADAISGVIQVKQALAAAEERNRLARDLHDSAKQRAFALNLQLSAARGSVPANTVGARLLDAALSLTSQLQQDLASVIGRLGAPTIAESGFRHALTEGVETLLTGSQIEYSIVLNNGDEALLAMLPEVERQLFLITLEAVANALKHARCTQCVISGKREGSHFIWRIVDNGTGCRSLDGEPQGMGLANMKLRADSLPHGHLDILTNDAGGTAIVVTFCLTNGGEHEINLIAGG